MNSRTTGIQLGPLAKHPPNVLNVLSMNIGGINDRKKRSCAREYLKSLKLDLVCLQETHIQYNERQTLDDLGLHRIIESRQMHRTRGVAILAKTDLGSKLKSASDVQGR